MSPISQLSVLAFASTVLATPYAGHGHGHAHRNLHRGAAPYPYAGGNGTTSAAGPTGTGGNAPSYGSSTSSEYDALTTTITNKNTVYQTVYQTVQGTTASNAQISAAGATDVCAADVTVTSTEKVYVTVTAGGASSSAPIAIPYGSSSSEASAPGYSAPAYSAPSSSEASPAQTSSSAPAYSAPAYSPSSESSSTAAPVTSSYVAPSSSAPAYTPTTEESSSSSPAAVVPTSYSATSSAAATSSTASSSGGKRGLAYNDASLTDCFSGSSMVSWAYNWLSSSAGLTGYKYIPMLHSNSDDFVGSWSSDAQAAIDSGSTTLFSFNEPDIASQANMAASAAAAAYKQYMNPFKGKASLCAPAVSNGAPDQGFGLGWLQSFLDACNGECDIDCYNIHWYGTEVQDLKDQTTKAIAMAGGKPVWVSEFAINGLSDDGINSFLEEIMPWFDSNENVAGYAYYMTSDGMLVSGDAPSSYGSTYKSYTS